MRKSWVSWLCALTLLISQQGAFVHVLGHINAYLSEHHSGIVTSTGVSAAPGANTPVRTTSHDAGRDHHGEHSPVEDEADGLCRICLSFSQIGEALTSFTPLLDILSFSFALPRFAVSVLRDAEVRAHCARDPPVPHTV